MLVFSGTPALASWLASSCGNGSNTGFLASGGTGDDGADGALTSAIVYKIKTHLDHLGLYPFEDIHTVVREAGLARLGRLSVFWSSSDGRFTRELMLSNKPTAAF